MPQLIWTPSAIADVERLHRFLLARNPDAARRAVQAIRQGVRLLREHPAAGRQRPGDDPAFRERIVGFGGSAYVVLYRVDDHAILILAIRHGREAGY